MKTLIKLFFAALITMVSSNAFATVWHVNNVGGLYSNFTTIQAAHDAAAAGDTLYVYGSATTYDNTILSLSKQLTIIGPGYFLSENLQTQANFTPATIGNINFRPNSGGSILTGFTTGQISIRSNNITIRRNRITGYIYLNDSSQSGYSISNIIISQNYLASRIFSYSTNLGTNNVVITNNISLSGITFTNGSNFNVYNNYFGDYINITNGTYRNNIQSNYNTSNGSIASSITNTLVQNNIFSGRTFNNGSAEVNIDSTVNKVNVLSMANVFTQTGSTDAKYQLKSGSPAIGYANGGGDCGPFGGTAPYILSGIPNIPAVYELNVPPTGGSSLNIVIKAKSHQ